MPRWPDKTVSSSENYSSGIEHKGVEERDPFPVKISEQEPRKRVRVPGTIFEVDEDGYLHVPDELLKALFDKKRYS